MEQPINWVKMAGTRVSWTCLHWVAVEAVDVYTIHMDKDVKDFQENQADQEAELRSTMERIWGFNRIFPEIRERMVTEPEAGFNPLRGVTERGVVVLGGLEV